MKNGYLGVDVSKGYADLVLLDSSKNKVGNAIKLPDTREGHNRLKKVLLEALNNNGFDRILCGIESTGGYENNWHYMLSSFNDSVVVRRLNPRGVRYEKEASLVRTENDKVSAMAIATHLMNHEVRIMNSIDRDLEFHQARKYYRNIQSMIKDQTRVKNRAEKLIYE